METIEKTPIQIEKPTVSRLQQYLLDKAPRGQGYSGFIEHALDVAGADRTDDAHLYHILVRETEPDADDDALIDGAIQLTDEQAADLEAKLERFQTEGHIGHFEVYRDDPVQTFAVEGVYNFITGDLEHSDTALRALWEGSDEGAGFECGSCEAFIDPAVAEPGEPYHDADEDCRAVRPFDPKRDSKVLTDV